MKSFSYLPLGTRFRYPGSSRVYTILTQYREVDDHPLSGTIATWEPDMVEKTTSAVFDPRDKGRSLGQNIFSHIPKEAGGDCPDMVEPID